ncbi:hypothetical protein PQU92_07600 [Asticcacaulis sp. BYS171W]|uniref:DUF4142 domain-containing protein n=1 Tax=Asticcacaulis aquaticus TaxID=2984212 RepID=A0ABT5HT73_9CAUL|nr:hypothetical protein [Asticcacaulis aquaticus]MDC7683137.1 hypothetical protein [Asticcacaulis aquaticus]
MAISGKIVTVMALGLMASASIASAETLVPPTLQGSFLSPEAPTAPKLVIDPALIGIAPKVEGTAASTVSVEDKAAAAKKTRKIALYKQLMELNGTAKNVRMILANTKSAVKLVILERQGKKNLLPSEEAKFDQIADRVLKEAEVTIIDQIATAQAAGFEEAEIVSLINANSGLAAAKYNAGKFANPEANAQQIQGFMVDAVVKIIKTFQQSISS